MTITDSDIQNVKNRYEIVGNSPLLRRAIETAIKVAPTDLSILITGESGVGKEAFSKIIHSLSRRKHNNFIALNCGAIPAGTIDSELFGHEKGAFTSAHESRKGYFETVNGGTIFLDEIGELPLETQSRLLRVLETGEFLKVGSSKVQKTDVRILAATNKDLLEGIEKNKFREDLYYRLSTVIIRIPPLRDRKEDVMLLFVKFATDFADKYNIPPIDVTPEAEQLIIKHRWPGNIRQLKNFVEEISVLEANRTLDAQLVRQYLPVETSKTLSVINHDNEQRNQSGLNEREILYKFLFDIKNDIADLKSFLYQVLNQLGGIRNQPNISSINRLLSPGVKPQNDSVFEKEYEESYNEGEEVMESEDSLSIQDKEKELIRKALVKHNGKRKSAAKDLGISERTLYRKIKEYELEDV